MVALDFTILKNADFSSSMFLQDLSSVSNDSYIASRSASVYVFAFGGTSYSFGVRIVRIHTGRYEEHVQERVFQRVGSRFPRTLVLRVNSLPISAQFQGFPGRMDQ